MGGITDMSGGKRSRGGIGPTIARWVPRRYLDASLVLLATCLLDIPFANYHSLVAAFEPGYIPTIQASSSKRGIATRCYLSTVAASMLAGSMAGAVGVGLSFPLDTVNTRSQLNALAEADQQKDKRRFHPFIGSVRVSEKTGGRSRQTESQQQHSSRHDDLVATAISIYRREGWRGFFSGARGMVAGESVIKAVAFGANSVALAAFQPYESGSTLQVGTTTPVSDEPSALALFAAACFAGTMAAFVVAPVERIKVVMQSSPQGMYRDEIECLRAIWKSQGPRGLLQGLDATIARDMPGYGLYFAIYEALTQNCDLGPVMSPALFGAAAGSASWIPVYPIDTVKTLLQRGVYNHTYVPSSSSSCTPQTAWQIIAQLYAQGGPGAFYRGLTPKLLRSAVNHAATFAVYESMMENLRQLAA